MLAMFGTGLSGSFTVKGLAGDVPPPGPGVETVMLADPAFWKSSAEIMAVIWLLLIKVVGRPIPFHWTVDDRTKFDPATSRLNDEPPAVATLGDRRKMMGAGLFIVNVTGFDMPPPGFGLNTVMVAVPADAISFVETMALSCVGDM